VAEVMYWYDADQEGWIAMDYDSGTIADADLMSIADRRDGGYAPE